MVAASQFPSLIKAVFFLVLEYSQINRLFRHINRGKVKVLMYHSISPHGMFFENSVSPSDFLLQVKYLRENYNVVSADALDDSNSYSADQINLIITFDDGFKDNRIVATEILRNEGLSAIFFVIGDCLELGSVPGFVRRKLGDDASAPPYHTIDLSDAGSMLECGMVIGAHSVRHDDYQLLGYKDGVVDAASVQLQLQNLLSVPVENFAFPWGRFRKGQENELLRTYRRVFLTDHGFNAPGDQVMFRNEVFSTLQLRAAASGSLDYFRGFLRACK